MKKNSGQDLYNYLLAQMQLKTQPSVAVHISLLKAMYA